MTITQTVRRIVAIIGIATPLAQNPVTAQTNNPTQSLVAGETAFATDLYGQLKTNQGNLFFSPYSISTCLAMTYAGARGETAREMARTLHFNDGPTNLPIPMGELEKELNQVRQKKGIELNTANGLWAQNDRKFLPSFLKIAEQQFGAVVKQVNFKTNAEPVRKEINAWVSKETKGKINDLLAHGVVNESTRMVLVNAIYFKGKWEHQFDKNKTTNAPFTMAANKKVQAPLMNIEERFNYADAGRLQLLELPYTAGDPQKPERPLSMIVLLPKDLNGLKKMEMSLNANSLSNWLAQAHPQKVKVFLPKFKMTQKFNLSQTLQSMGMEEAFNALANFSGMDDRRDLQISDVIHKAYVDVNEEGTEAAAATGTTMRALAEERPKPVPVFRADHPFIFFIRDNRSGRILFLGRVNDPTTS